MKTSVGSRIIASNNDILLADNYLDPFKIIGFNDNILYTSQKSPDKKLSGKNEDSLLIHNISEDHLVLAISDGAGGHPKGEYASKKILKELSKTIKSSKKSSSHILEIIFNTNKIISKVKAKATLSLVEIQNNNCTFYQIGDSCSLIINKLGNTKYRSIQQSPVGYQLYLDQISEKESLKHPDLNFVFNLLGDKNLQVTVGPTIKLNKTDTLLIASDGLTDNILTKKLAQIIKGKNVLQIKKNLKT